MSGLRWIAAGQVLPHLVVDNSALSPTGLTIPRNPVYPSWVLFPFTSFQAERILMAFHVFLFLLVSFLTLCLFRIWSLCWPDLGSAQSRAATKMRTRLQRLLKPRTLLDCPTCCHASTPSPVVWPAPPMSLPAVSHSRPLQQRGGTRLDMRQVEQHIMQGWISLQKGHSKRDPPQHQTVLLSKPHVW